MNSDILFFFSEHMDALPMYEKLEEQILAQIPDVKIKVAKTQITFANKRGFAFVSFNPCRKAAQRPKVLDDRHLRSGIPERISQNRRSHGALSWTMDPPCNGGKYRRN